ncbi:polygalacturonase QRT3-like [Trifolium pratense]|uniref:polygalacturonase QRT3-like n=1 Tax=Trifolium pratense TaxID=57577 RepID=UPI001E690445|nr:polygalacturonase QRT3-like [Trifolium pratense]
MQTTMARISPLWFMLLLMMAYSSSYVTHAYKGKLPLRIISGATHHHEAMLQLNAFKVSFTKHDSIASPPSSFSPSPSPSPMPPKDLKKPHEYLVTSYGADPTGNSDSTEALLAAIADAAKGPSKGFLVNDIIDLGGAQINLEGGNYLISKPLQFPVAGVGNLMIHGGSIRASNTFPPNKNLIDLSNYGSTSHSYNYEYITLKDLFLDSNFKGGGISITNSLRINIDNCYITHFTTNGILVQSGHETYIRNCFIGQHITAGGDKNERKFSGIGISLQGNDNAITDVVIFSAAIGIMITGQANIISGVHCYNKASGFGGTGIYLKLPGLTQTRIVNSYMDYTNIVAEDPVQLHISSSFFLGDAKIVLKSIKGVVNGLNIVDNMFSGSNHGVEIVKLDTSITPFNQIEQVFVARNVVNGMNLKATSAMISMHGNGTSWIADFNKILIFPNLIRNVEYSLSASGNTFPNHALRNVSHNIVVIETNEVVTANIYVKVDQGITS